MKARTVQLDKKTIFFVMDEFIFLTRTFERKENVKTFIPVAERFAFYRRCEFSKQVPIPDALFTQCPQWYAASE
jgi:hypothetical protein